MISRVLKMSHRRALLLKYLKAARLRLAALCMQAWQQGFFESLRKLILYILTHIMILNLFSWRPVRHRDQLDPIGRKRMRKMPMEPATRWWWSSEDYSMPHRRSPVHHDLEPWRCRCTGNTRKFSLVFLGFPLVGEEVLYVISISSNSTYVMS